MSPPPARRRARWLPAVLLGLGALALVQLRDRIPAVVAWHRWLHAHGVPPPVRSLDAPLLLLLGAWLGARIAAGRGAAARALGLRGSWREGLVFGLVAALPMLVQGWLGRTGVDLSLATARGVVVMPFVEEVFFRGLLVFVPVALGGCRFWPVALAAGLLFGSLHVGWQWPPDAGDLPVFVMTAAGGVWYAWIGRRFQWNLWPAIWLHAAMNAAWAVFAVAGDAAGGLWPNIGRGLTIALGTVLALRRARRSRHNA